MITRSFTRLGDNTFNDEEDELQIAKQMTRDDFDYMTGRIDFMELSVASIINKVLFILL